MAPKPHRRASDHITVKVPLDRRRTEALQLELRRLARRYGLEVMAVQIRKVKAKG